MQNVLLPTENIGEEGMLGLFTEMETKRTRVCHVIALFSPDMDKTFPFLPKPLKIIESYFVFVGQSQELSGPRKI